MTDRLPDRATLLARLRRPELDRDEADDDDVRRIELRRAMLEIAEVDQAAELALAQAVADRYRRP
jgi:hypothetical protein